MNKFTLFLFILCIFTLGAKAQTQVQIGDLYYNLDDASLTAETAAMPLAVDGSQPRYAFATVTVPATVDYGGKTYNVVEIGNSTFQRSPNLMQVTLPTSITMIADSAFRDSPNLIAVTGTDHASVIGNYAFFHCVKLAFIQLSPNLKQISEHCFQQDSTLTNVTIPEGVTSIKVCAFQSCANLNAVTIPSTVNEIVQWSFDGTSVKSITVPEGVTKISAWTFSDNQALTTLKLPASLTRLENWACDKDANIQSIYVAWPTPPVNDEANGIGMWGFGDKVDRNTCIVYVPQQYTDAYGVSWFYFPVQSYVTGITNVSTETAHAYYADGTLNLIDLDGYTVSVYSANGQLAASFKADKSAVQLPLASGVYILKATNGQVTKAIKFIAK